MLAFRLQPRASQAKGRCAIRTPHMSRIRASMGHAAASNLPVAPAGDAVVTPDDHWARVCNTMPGASQDR